jgi:transcriptional regulator with XRE-family HTH domain
VQQRPPTRARRLCFERGITNRALAERLGISETWVSLVMNGRKAPSRSLARHIALVLGIPEAELFEQVAR